MMADNWLMIVLRYVFPVGIIECGIPHGFSVFEDIFISWYGEHLSLFPLLFHKGGMSLLQKCPILRLLP